MKRTWKVWVAAVFGLAAIAAWIRFLVGQTIENAGVWSSIVALPVAAALSLAAIIVAWLAWKHPRAPADAGETNTNLPRISFHAGRDSYIANEMNIKQQNYHRPPDSGEH